MEAVNLQVKLSGKYAEAFELFKNRPIMGGSKKNTLAMKEIIRTLPEFKEVGGENEQG